MYHVLAFIDGEWVSFGLHAPSPQWTKVFQALQRTHGHHNVRYMFWFPDKQLQDVAAVRSRAMSEVQLANEAQCQWDAGELSDAADDNGSFHLSRGIIQLRQKTA